MAATTHPESQLLRELEAPSSSEEEGGTPKETSRYMPTRAIPAALALCGAAAIAAVVVLQPGAMGNARASTQKAVSLATSSKYECPVCSTTTTFQKALFICGDNAVKQNGCATSGCQVKTKGAYPTLGDYCIQPAYSTLAATSSSYKYGCTTQPQNNPYECKEKNGGCALNTCEVGKTYSKTTSTCSTAQNLSDTTCGANGCLFKSGAECYAPDYTELIQTTNGNGVYEYTCQYTGKKPSHPYMCPKPPSKAASCVLGTSLMNILARGETLVRDVNVGDKVLTHRGIYEPIIDFLHALPKTEGARLIHIKHATGRVSASAEHMVFVFDAPSERLLSKAMEDVRVGDFLVDSEGQHRAVTSVAAGVSGSEGLFAPLTPSGMMIVDGMLMSNYASVGGKRIPHGAMHAAFFLLRVLRAIVPASRLASADQLNPMAKLLWRVAGPWVLPASI